MAEVRLGRDPDAVLRLREDPELVAVRTRSRRSLLRGPVPTAEAALLEGMELVAEFPEAGVEVYRHRGGDAKAANAARLALKGLPDVRFAGRVLVEEQSGEPVLYTENFFVKFKDEVEPEDCEAILRAQGLIVKRTVPYATNGYFVEAPEGTGQEVFTIADRLMALPEVEICHPELVQRRFTRAIAPEQWHLRKTMLGNVEVDAHANAAAAHELQRGAGATIAVIDDGFDLSHPEFATPGKVVAPRDFFTAPVDDDPSPGPGDNHGTACAGVACASGLGASGVAPEARLMPLRMPSGLGSQREADAFVWAADHGADVISCSWGPPDGAWYREDDPAHQTRWPLPESTRLAMDYAATRGRGGKGCLIFFAAGNGRESVDLDGYASYERVHAVAACNDRGRRSVYSDFGKAVFCAFPSNDFGWPPENRPEPLTPGIWTTDRRGHEGYNPGDPRRGDAAGDYTNGFGGTSSACPGAAGVAALVIAHNPALRANEVSEILRRACSPIDPQDGAYDAQGRSPYYGYGRLDARRAVELARPAEPAPAVVVTRTYAEPISDFHTARVQLEVGEDQAIERVVITVDIEHSWIGDLVVTLRPPAGTGVPRIRLHERGGGATQGLRRTYDANSVPALARLAGKRPRGRWALEVQDMAALDVGMIRGFTLGLHLAAERAVVEAPKRRAGARRKEPEAA